MPAEELLHCLVELLFLEQKILILFTCSLHLVGHQEGIEIDRLLALRPTFYF